MPRSRVRNSRQDHNKRLQKRRDNAADRIVRAEIERIAYLRNLKANENPEPLVPFAMTAVEG